MVSEKSTDVSKSLQSSRWGISWITKSATLASVMSVMTKNVIVSVTKNKRYLEYPYSK